MDYYKMLNEVACCNAMTKHAANDFFNYGAGSMANEVLADYDKEEGADNPDREKVKDLYGKWVDKSILPTAAVGGAAGLGTAGLTYAGLGLIPSAKRNRLIRMLAGLAVGVPAGAVAGHFYGRHNFENLAKENEKKLAEETGGK